MTTTLRVATAVRILTLTTAGLALPSLALATPSTTYWAPSVATCQGYAVPHITYDTYYGKGVNRGYPVDTGLTMGVIPGDKVQAEVGYDVLLPSTNPMQFYLNAKVCVTENTIAKGAPAISVGIYNLGFKTGFTNFNILYATAQKSLPFGGYITVGGYHGLSTSLGTELFSSTGSEARNGFIGAWSSPDIKVPIKGISKIDVIADVQTGKNAFGAGGFGADIYFNDYIGLIVGPVFYFDKNLQPDGATHLWTTQLDVDIPFGKK